MLHAIASVLFASWLSERDNFDPEDGRSRNDRDEAQNERQDDHDDYDDENDGDGDGDDGAPDDEPRNEDEIMNRIIHSVDFPQLDADNGRRNKNVRGRIRRRLSSASTSFVATFSTPRPSTWWSRVKSSLTPKSPNSSSESSDPINIPHYRLAPILSGVVIPFSILLEIPGLTEDWYIRTGEGNKTVQTKPNTPILETGAVVSFVCAVIANAFLVMRFLEYKVLASTVACIGFLTIHDLINITTVTIFGVIHRFDDGFTYGQPYWMTLCSTVASLVTNITLIYDLRRIKDFGKRGSGLTRKQRSLIIIVIILLCYVALGGLINSILLHLSFINGLYFTVVTIETIGYGDISPKSTGAKVWTCLYASVGIVYLGVAVRMCRDTVLEGLEVGYRKRVESVRRRRREMKRRREVGARWREQVEWRLRQKRELVWLTESSDRGWVKIWKMCKPWRKWAVFGGGRDQLQLHHGDGGMYLNLDALTPTELEATAMAVGVPLDELLPLNYMTLRQRRIRRSARNSEDGNRKGDVGKMVGIEDSLAGRGLNHPDMNKLTYARMGKMVSMLGRFALAVHGQGAPDGDGTMHKDENSIMPAVTSGNGNGESSTQNYESFRKGMEKEERRAFMARLIVAWSLFVLFWVVGSAIFRKTEGWSYGTAMYFCFVSFSSIGYGDFAPTTPAGRSIFVVWALLGVGTMTILISVLSEAYSTKYRKAVHTRAFENAVKRYRLRSPMIATAPSRSSISVVRPRGVPFPSEPISTWSTSVSYAPLPIRTTSPKGLSGSRTRAISIMRSRSGSPSPEDSDPQPPRVPSPTPSETAHEAQKKLDALPQEILRQAKAFHDHVRYFLGMCTVEEAAPDHLSGGGGADGGIRGREVPESLRLLLNDITGVERGGETVKKEILRDDEAKKTLFALSMENSLVRLIESAEGAVGALAQRNVLTHQQ